ncbi:MAG TPA: hypothetical protein VLH79_01305 [Chthonomonadales bacterium]|nr:hypothetical protein [Chthonomonadales bacterium]
MNQALRDLYELQQTDSAIAAAQRRLDQLDPGSRERAAAVDARERHDRVDAEHRAHHAELRDAELRLQAVEEKRKNCELKLYGGQVRAFKELEAMQMEIEALSHQRAALDERILTLMDTVETLRSEAAEAAAAMASADDRLARVEAAYATASAKLRHEIERLGAERVRQASAVPPPLLRRYESIRAGKHGVGITIIEDGRCVACRTTLPLEVVRSVIESDRVEVCENCNRLLCIIDS